jgi:hypothetical protein
VARVCQCRLLRPHIVIGLVAVALRILCMLLVLVLVLLLSIPVELLC